MPKPGDPNRSLARDDAGSDESLSTIATLRGEIANSLRRIYHEKSKNDPALTQEALGQALGLSKSGVNHLLTGRSPLPSSHAVLLAKILKVDIRSIVEPNVALDRLERSLGATPTTHDGTLDRAWELVKREFPFATEDEKFEFSRNAARMIPPSAALPSDEDILNAMKRYIVSRGQRETTT